MKLNTYAIFVSNDNGWIQECPDRHGVFFGSDETYVHPVNGGIEPAGHIVVYGYKTALAKCALLNNSGDWHSAETGRNDQRPTYALAKIK